MHQSRLFFALALGGSLLVWIVTWWRTPPLQTVRHGDSVSAIQYSPDGHLYVVESNRGISGRISDPQAYSLAISPDGQHLATGGRDGVVRVWDVANGQLLQSLAHAP